VRNSLILIRCLYTTVWNCSGMSSLGSLEVVDSCEWSWCTTAYLQHSVISRHCRRLHHWALLIAPLSLSVRLCWHLTVDFSLNSETTNGRSVHTTSRLRLCFVSISCASEMYSLQLLVSAGPKFWTTSHRNNLRVLRSKADRNAIGQRRFNRDASREGVSSEIYRRYATTLCHAANGTADPAQPLQHS
jgi:hypothetical protein